MQRMRGATCDSPQSRFPRSGAATRKRKILFLAMGLNITPGGRGLLYDERLFQRHRLVYGKGEPLGNLHLCPETVPVRTEVGLFRSRHAWQGTTGRSPCRIP